MLSAVRKADGPCPVAASVTTPAPEDAATLEVAGPITVRPSPIGPAEESDQHRLKPIVALMPKTHLILRQCRIDSLTIQPIRYQVKKPHTQNPPRAAVEFDSWGGPSQNTSTISRYGSALICSQHGGPQSVTP
jgi:hypothetical protein